MMKSDFEKRRAEKADRYKRLAEKSREESNSRYTAAKQISSFIPFGQPILVGHHSEKRHRRDLERIDTNMRKSIEADDKAAYYQNKAANAEDESRIFSDDPRAIEKLKEKLASLKKSHELMKSINAHFRKYGHVKGLNLSDEMKSEIEKIITFGSGERIPFAGYSLRNSNSNIQTVSKRLKQLEKAAKETTKEETINGVRVVENVEANRLQLFFSGKPEDELRTQLKQNGFRWSPRLQCWQRHRSSHASYKARLILGKARP